VSGIVSFRELAAVVKRFHGGDGVPTGERIYSDYIRRRDVWDRLGEVTEPQVGDVVVGFPNKWKTRIPYDCVPDLTRVLRSLNEPLRSLRAETLLNVDFNGATATNSMTPSQVIINCFKAISQVRARNREFGFTGTTKVLHMIVPELFIMCDDSIATGYGYARNTVGYGKFIIEMQQFARSIVDSYKSESGTDDTQAVREILRLCNDEGKAFTKALDEYNYTIWRLEIR
jgi:hypothetical protein